MEVVIWSSSLTNPAFSKTLFTTLQVLMSEFGMRTFNVGIQDMSFAPMPLKGPEPSRVGGVVAK